MASFIQYDDQTVVNLERVTHVYIMNDEKSACVYFMFDAMYGEHVNETKWIVKSQDDMARILARLNIEPI